MIRFIYYDSPNKYVQVIYYFPTQSTNLLYFYPVFSNWCQKSFPQRKTNTLSSCLFFCNYLTFAVRELSSFYTLCFGMYTLTEWMVYDYWRTWITQLCLVRDDRLWSVKATVVKSKHQTFLRATVWKLNRNTSRVGNQFTRHDFIKFGWHLTDWGQVFSAPFTHFTPHAQTHFCASRPHQLSSPGNLGKIYEKHLNIQTSIFCKLFFHFFVGFLPNCCMLWLTLLPLFWANPH